MENDNKPFIFTIPPDYYSLELGDIWKLIENIDGYKMFGEQLGDLANEICKSWHSDGKLPDNPELIIRCSKINLSGIKTYSKSHFCVP